MVSEVEPPTGMSPTGSGEWRGRFLPGTLCTVLKGR